MIRATLRTLFVGVTALCVIVAAGFALQAAALGRPDQARLILARTVGELDGFHQVETTITLGGERLASACVQRWRLHLRVAAVSIVHGPTIVEVAPKLPAVDKRELDEFVLAGCPRPLADWITTQLGRGEPIVFRRARLGRQRVYAIRFRAAPIDLELYVGRLALLPVRLELHGGGLVGTSAPVYGSAGPRPWWWSMAHARGL